ncbi:MAG: hypothetical protein ABI601_08325 [bacterium]
MIAPALTLARIPLLLAAPAMNVTERAPNLPLHQTPDTLRAHVYFGVSTRGLGETLRFGAMMIEDALRRYGRHLALIALYSDVAPPSTCAAERIPRSM